MKAGNIFLTCLLFLISYVYGAAQTAGTVNGTVTDEDGQPVVGAVVMLQNHRDIATVTAGDGGYSLELPDGIDNPAIEVSCLGYGTVIERLNGRRTVVIVLKEDSEMLEETVIVGYGTQKKVNLTGAVTSIDFDDRMENRTIVNTSAALAGLSPGLSVMQTSGQPGSESTRLRIRGMGSFTSDSNNPLVLVDGVEWSMDDVNPNDIASISVLKDASSTAIYGTRAANGVILITTKMGEESRPQISYSFKGIFQSPYNRLHFVSDYADHMELINESRENIGSSAVFTQDNIDLWRAAKLTPDALTEAGVPYSAAYPNTDWFSEIFDTGFSQEHNVTISGGSKSVRYLASVGYLDNQGVMNRFDIDSSTEKLNFRANLEADVTKWFTFGFKIFGQRQSYGLASVSNAFNYLYQTTPGVYPGSPNFWGRAALNDQESTNANNILHQMYGSKGYNRMTRLNGTAYVRFRPYKGISIEGTFNYAPTHRDRHTYSSGQNGFWDYVTNTRYSSASLENATVSRRVDDTYRMSTELLGRYNGTFGNHEVGALLGFSTQEYWSWAWGLQKKGATDWSLSDLDTYETLNAYNNTPKTGWTLMSWFGRVNYVFRDRYLFEANFRVDGSSKFGSDRKYGFFPSFSAGWRIDQEPFMSGTETWLSNLKLRASWGQTGNNQGIGNYTWQAVYATGNMVLDGVPTTGLYISSLSNSMLHWETTTTTDIGLDMGFFDNRLTAEADWYLKNTTDILYSPKVYMTMGQVGGVPANLGSMRNTGIEIALGWQDTVGKDFHYFVNANVSYNRNRVTKFKGNLVKEWRDGTYYSNYADVAEEVGGMELCEGHALGEHYIRSIYRGTGEGYKGGLPDPGAGPVDGIIRTEADMEWVQSMMAAGYSFNGNTAVGESQLWYGDLIYQDRDGDGNYGDEDDRDYNGHTDTPSVLTGINLGFSWKGLDFSMTWSGAFDFYIYWATQYYNGTKLTNGCGISSRVADDHYFYNPDNPSDPRTNIGAAYPRLTYETDLGNALESDFYEYRGDYLKLKNIQIGYTLPEHITRKFFVRQLRFFVSGENILTLTGYPGLDPEKGSAIGYPLMRQYTAGAQITF